MISACRDYGIASQWNWKMRGFIWRIRFSSLFFIL